jgi:hypothetical protein
MAVGDAVPTHYHQAISGPNSEKWKAAILKEIKAMNRLGVWDIVKLSPLTKTVGTTWVFRVKLSPPDGVPEYKARLCAQGFSQTHGIDYSKTFAPTGRLNSLRALISHASIHNLEFGQLDVKTAFLNADLEETVHLSIPQGVVADCKQYCLKLNKAIYGLKQAPLAWYNCLSAWLVQVGFKISVCDPCVFYRSSPTPTWLFLHVDDIAVFGPNISAFKNGIKLEFNMKDMGCADLLLGIKIHHESDAIVLSQRHSVTSLLDLYSMTNCRSTATPLIPNVHLSKATTEEFDRFKCLGVNYHSAIGALSYLSTATRPDICFAVSHLSQFLENPGILHWEAFTHVLRYLSSTANYVLVYSWSATPSLHGYTDADWGNCLQTRRSVTGFLTLQNSHLVAWHTKKQPEVSLSLCEAEYRALVDYSAEVLWLQQLRLEINLSADASPVIVHEDNQGCIAVANSEANSNSRRLKHVEIQLQFIREVIKSNRIRLQYTATSGMLADFLTKCQLATMTEPT